MPAERRRAPPRTKTWPHPEERQRAPKHEAYGSFVGFLGASPIGIGRGTSPEPTRVWLSTKRVSFVTKHARASGEAGTASPVRRLVPSCTWMPIVERATSERESVA